MILLLLVAFLFFSIIGMTRDWDEDGVGILVGCFLICLLLTAVFGGFVINGRTIQSKIEMYQTENKDIETSMDTLVKQYMDYESGTYGDLKGQSSITLVSLYPDLKSDELVKSQLEVYVNNNNKIKKLKEKLINVSNWRWWLYFGK